ncbi:CAP-associated domain-containing protein [Enterococcus alishanensis]|uniref:CAP-associated domain-containing protein n=1 Tax=Enterococcus alishanensis TaxID=1303817 RepID=A0ABS6TBJ4_9ENTE|nr:CAP-associated domain-containing protein [Enterococcus alishanensis]MBV7390276.1 hypothetical protein [Enterococcus alishanensis]
MKRVIGFVAIFLLVIIGYYVQPILFPRSSVNIPVQPTESSVSHQPLKHTVVESDGFANYIGGSLESFEAVYGLPNSVENSGFFFEIRTYSVESGILEVNIEENKITAIKVLGNQIDSGDFSFGKTIRKLASQYNLSADFSLDFDEEPVMLELSEDDMRHRPLIAFNNDSFAMVFFNGTSEKLIGTVYMDKETLLRFMPYKINSGNPLSSRMQESNLDWSMINQQRQQRTIQSVNAYRLLIDQPVYTNGNNEDSQRMIVAFLNQPQNYLSTARQEAWDIEQSAYIGNLHFELTEKELKELAEDQKTDFERALYYSPEIDPTFTLLYWLSQTHLTHLFDQADPGKLNIAFSQESVLILIQQPSTEDSQ